MNRRDAARLLGVAEGTLERWVRQGLIRSHDRKGQDFDRAELSRWARDRGIRVEPDPAGEPGKGEAALVAAIERGSVTAGVEASSAVNAIQLAIEDYNRA